MYRRWIVSGLVAAVAVAAFSLGRISNAPDAEAAETAPSIHHILLEVSDLDRSIAFYRDRLGLELKSRSGDFVTLESANVGVYLWSKRWDWETVPAEGERAGLGIYPHFAVHSARATVERLREAGDRIVQEAALVFVGRGSLRGRPGRIHVGAHFGARDGSLENPDSVRTAAANRERLSQMGLGGGSARRFVRSGNPLNAKD